MRNAKGLEGLAAAGHGVTVERGHQRIGCSRRIEQDRRHCAADRGTFHDADQKAEHGKKRRCLITENADQDRKRNRHRHRSGKPRNRPDNDAGHKAEEHCQNRQRNAQSQNMHHTGPVEDRLKTKKDMITNAHHRSPLGGRIRSSKGRSNAAPMISAMRKPMPSRRQDHCWSA